MTSLLLLFKSSFNTLFFGSLSLFVLVNPQNTLAQRFPESSQRSLSERGILKGTRIPIHYQEFQRIILTERENLPLTVTISANLYNRRGKVIIPYGSEIFGQLQPIQKGIQFVAYQVHLPRTVYPIKAVSQVVNRRQIIESEVEAVNLTQGTLFGLEAAKAITPLISQDTSHVGLRELSGWLLGHLAVNVFVIYPNQDLTLTLQSDFSLD